MPIGQNRNLKFRAAEVVSFTDQDIIRFLMELDQMHKTVPLTRFHYTEDGMDAGFPLYTYRLNAEDGRLWKQTLRFDNPSNPGQTFDVDDFWRLPEFQPHRVIRDSVILLTARIGLLEVDVKWEP